ncbi:Putative zn(2)Cys(6) fungal-type DNA-binding domain-containing protein [Colletotrichum destructivum]|uniref:Zn(2)Cys(6) fungal-type DNA-binding domain-containing protein n=1 Tax=Colletotrichum destructivum TaxID=34406 RepID=A0AAX4ISQ4_9PEZI|nr:Putative zn(2)Cys(6) fungal-type DNA-binding domain-containing protein [Colletotrichum destructivum]
MTGVNQQPGDDTMTPLSRPKKTDIVRKRTGCQRCRSRKRKCDETRPECLACVQRGIPCSGYQSRIRFKDISDRTAEMSKRVEAARWSALRDEDAARLRLAKGGARDIRTPTKDRQNENHRGEDHAEENARRILGCDFDGAADHTSSPVAMLDLENASLRQILEQQQPLSFLGDEVNDDTDHAARLSPSLSMGVFPFSRPPFEVSNRFDFLSAAPETSRRLIPSLSPDNTRDPLALWNSCATEADAPSWEDMLDFPDPSSHAQTPLLGGEPTTTLSTVVRQRGAGITEDSLLETFEKDVAPRIALQMLPFTDLFRASTGLRAAALALTTGYLRLCRTSDPEPTSPGTRPGPVATGVHCHYYDFAVADLAHQLEMCPGPEAADALVCAAILLVYRDIAVGSHRDVCGHLRQLEALSAAVDDLASRCHPALLRAWRLFSFDMRLCSLVTRKSVAGPPPPPLQQTCAPWDSRLTIRDIFSSLWRLHGRAVMEASFSESGGGGPAAATRQSASRRAVQWLCSVFGRRCDLRQWEQRDYHDETLSDDAITTQCRVFESRLDAWHRATARNDLPVPCLGTGAEGVVAGGGFGAVVPYDIPDRSAAIDYSLYLISRMTCLHLQSRYQARRDPKHASVLDSDVLARVALGILLKTGPAWPAAAFGEPNVLTLLYMTALVSEGASIATAVLEGVLPRFGKDRDLPAVERNEMLYMERLMEMVVRERYRGRSVRFAIDSYDEDHRRDATCSSRQRRIAVFGDFGGRGHFRDVVYMGANACTDVI